jgi:hypothetical protein
LTSFAIIMSDDLEQSKRILRTEGGQVFLYCGKNFSRQCGVVDADARGCIERPAWLRAAVLSV